MTAATVLLALGILYAVGGGVFAGLLTFVQGPVWPGHRVASTLAVVLMVVLWVPFMFAAMCVALGEVAQVTDSTTRPGLNLAPWPREEEDQCTP